MAVSTVAVWAGVSLIGGVGSVLRFLTDRAVARRAARPFPFGTLTVNVSGAALLAFIGSLALSREAALLAGTSFVGAYTTFSTWMLETQRLGEERAQLFAGACQPALHRADRDAEGDGDLFIGPVQRVALDEDRAMARVQPVHANRDERRVLADRGFAHRARRLAGD
jgi:CrcB protein